MRWSWRKSFTLIWAMTVIAFALTWIHGWEWLASVVVRFWRFVWFPCLIELTTRLSIFLDRFPEPWMVVAWRVAISASCLLMTGLTLSAWVGPATRPAWLTWSGLWQAILFPFRKSYRWARYWWHPPDLDRMVETKEDENLNDAYGWAGAYVPTRNGVVYEVVLKHAENSYKEVTEISATLDRKADDLMKISGAVGAALAAAGRIAGISQALTSRPIVLAVGCLVATMLICARARKPSKKIVPMTVRTAIELAEMSGLKYIPDEDEEADEKADQIGPEPSWTPQPPELVPSPNQVKATIAASYHWAVTGTKYVIEWKARLITVATFAFCLGLILLVLGFQGRF